MDWLAYILKVTAPAVILATWIHVILWLTSQWRLVWSVSAAIIPVLVVIGVTFYFEVLEPLR